MSGGSMVAPGDKKSLTELMKDRGFTLASLAALVGVTDISVSYWRTKRTKPRPETYEKLLSVLQVTAEEIDLEPAGLDPEEIKARGRKIAKAHARRKELLLNGTA